MLGSLTPPLLGKRWVKVFNMLILISPNKVTMAVVNPEIEKKLVKSYKAMKRLSPKTNARNFKNLYIWPKKVRIASALFLVIKILKNFRAIGAKIALRENSKIKNIFFILRLKKLNKKLSIME